MYHWRKLTVIMLLTLGLPQTVPAQSVQEVDSLEAMELPSVQLDQESDATGETPTREAFTAIAQAWLDEDYTALAAMIAEDGVVIAIAPDPERDRHYSPDQAYYFFKNLFQSSSTDSFDFRRWQEKGAGSLVHGVADWNYHRAGSEAKIGERFIFTLTHSKSGWGLTEIRTIR